MGKNKLSHIAIATPDPEKTAAFYKEVFGFEEVGRTNTPLATGVYLSDGTLNMAILRFHTDQLGRGLDYQGLHHFGKPGRLKVGFRRALVKPVEQGSRLLGAQAE